MSNYSSADSEFLRKEGKALRGDPSHKEEGAGSYGQDQQRAEVCSFGLTA